MQIEQVALQPLGSRTGFPSEVGEVGRTITCASRAEGEASARGVDLIEKPIIWIPKEPWSEENAAENKSCCAICFFEEVIWMVQRVLGSRRRPLRTRADVRERRRLADLLLRLLDLGCVVGRLGENEIEN